MHTTSEPTLIFHKLFPNIQGNLLEQRAGAKKSHDTVRQQLILEPRGHWDIYDAILRQKTELVALAETDIGVLFMHDDGFSTMDGRAAIDLDRFFVDTHDLAIFLRRNELKNNRVSETTVVSLRSPCGIVKITLPTKSNSRTSDPSWHVSFVSVPSVATGINLTLSIPEGLRWPQLRDRTIKVASISYGRSFYCIVSAAEIGFFSALAQVDMTTSLNIATRSLKAEIDADSDIQKYPRHLDLEDLGVF